MEEVDQPVAPPQKKTPPSPSQRPLVGGNRRASEGAAADRKWFDCAVLRIQNEGDKMLLCYFHLACRRERDECT